LKGYQEKHAGASLSQVGVLCNSLARGKFKPPRRKKEKQTREGNLDGELESKKSEKGRRGG
jgi:hypothetical protein